MKTATLAKTLGCASLNEVAGFYQVTTQNLRDKHANNPKAFIAMVLGYKQVQNLDVINTLNIQAD
ncbi:hypothetical protein J4N45_14450 [Vibrio sp. SCSIO 43140]|uniref:hypothetical protein n=1 Tax=Vibrio sp. SCSIO 43140 TaxID=2819100 RepID=UPI0020764A46|nr:hypothetical protein [Vibrio sp. SCSIO 43140]USD58811.1 hypothetical protein J4N45_09735 [Vibrio sp. SCSIO 43140]USD59145.1 hypothetical protein J4N45_11440 [Vibrio sp. SCSIO 43140]USD59702.1 hypothetical protein J4N45_14450 [Vibrio sp. SCSIO 43140]